MCLVTTTSASNSSGSNNHNHYDTSKMAGRPLPKKLMPKSTKTPTTQRPSSSKSKQQPKQSRNNHTGGKSTQSSQLCTTKRKGVSCSLGLFLLAGCSWTLYALHRSTGRLVTTVVQQDIDKEAQYLSGLFRNSPSSKDAIVATTTSAAAVLEGAVTREGAASRIPTAMEQMEQRLLNDAQSALRGAFLSQDYDPQQTAAAASVPAHASATSSYQIDFSNLHPDRNHAILIPYRNRKFHLEQFIEHMGPYLNRNFPNDTFELWIMEQGDNFLFNRAWLVNVGIASIKQQNRIYQYERLQQQQQLRLQQRQGNNTSQQQALPVTVPPPPRCIILHDVDLIPTVEGVPYTDCSRPIQLGSELAHFNDSIPYPIYTGGVGPSMTLDHWNTINGMSNDFYGWGGEDDELWHRLRLNGLLKNPVRRPTQAPSPGGKDTGPKFWPPEIIRPPKGKGRFRPISEADTVHHNQKTHNQWARIGHMLDQMQNNSARWRSDGLSDLRMTVTGDAMTITHWDSVSLNNHTVLDPGVVATLQATTTTITRKHFVSAKQQGSIISSLSIAPTALASFAAIHHIKAIPKITALEFLHVTQTDGGRIERAGAKAGIAWGACHFHHALEVPMKCPDILDPELEGKARQLRERASHTPWQSPLQDFEKNPYKGRPTFAVVRNPYDRLIDFFYCPWNGYKGDRTPNATDLNLFLRNAMYPELLESSLKEEKEGGKKTDAPKPKPEAFLFLRPQFHYVFASNQIALYSKPFVTHVLRFETIEEDFGNLMRLYNLHDKVRLPARDPSSSKHAKTLTPLHFDGKTLDMIHRFYAGDFARFNYSQMHRKPNHQ